MVTLPCSGEVSRETSNHEAWQEGRLLTVGDARYVVEMNPPTVQKVGNAPVQTINALSEGCHESELGTTV